MLNGINHITVAVNDLDESFKFYVNLLGMKPHGIWQSGAYLSLNDLWFCLSVDSISPARGYSHIALDVSEDCFEKVKSQLLEKQELVSGSQTAVKETLCIF